MGNIQKLLVFSKNMCNVVTFDGYKILGNENFFQEFREMFALGTIRGVLFSGASHTVQGQREKVLACRKRFGWTDAPSHFARLSVHLHVGSLHRTESLHYSKFSWNISDFR